MNNESMHDSGEFKYFGDIYYNGLGSTCPVCGGKIKHQYTGNITSEQMEEDSKCCLWIEHIDEGRSTIGYRPMCRGDINIKT